MATALCVFSLILCKISNEDISMSSKNALSENLNSGLGIPLKTQVVNVPRFYISPCPEIFRYTFDGSAWMGLATIRKPAAKGINSKIKIVLSVGFHFSSVRLKKINERKNLTVYNFSGMLEKLVYSKIGKPQSMISQMDYQ